MRLKISSQNKSELVKYVEKMGIENFNFQE